jgi:hypothetical protein
VGMKRVNAAVDYCNFEHGSITNAGGRMNSFMMSEP